jgi:septal ring factor EnvC (AmiA/AmiB activator)
MGFLAMTDQVDKKIADEDAKVAKTLESQKAELAKVQQELADIRSLKDQAQATIDELRALSKKVEGRMVTLPKETLLKLAEILQNALGPEGQ